MINHISEMPAPFEVKKLESDEIVQLFNKLEQQHHVTIFGVTYYIDEIEHLYGDTFMVKLIQSGRPQFSEMLKATRESVNEILEHMIKTFD